MVPLHWVNESKALMALRVYLLCRKLRRNGQHQGKTLRGNNTTHSASSHPHLRVAASSVVILVVQHTWEAPGVIYVCAFGWGMLLSIEWVWRLCLWAEGVEAVHI